MCYSARIVADYRKYVRMFDAGLSLNDFVELFWNRNNDAGVRIPKAMETPFADATSGQEGQIRALIDEYVSDQKVRYEQEVFKQRTRLAAAERKLASKPTKSAAESQRINPPLRPRAPRPARGACVRRARAPSRHDWGRVAAD